MFPLVSLPAGDAEGCPPAVLPPGWRSIYQARQRSANVVLILAKAAPQVRTDGDASIAQPGEGTTMMRPWRSPGSHWLDNLGGTMGLGSQALLWMPPPAADPVMPWAKGPDT